MVFQTQTEAYAYVAAESSRLSRRHTRRSCVAARAAVLVELRSTHIRSLVLTLHLLSLTVGASKSSLAWVSAK